MADRIRVSTGHTFEAGKYESVRVDLAVEMDAEEGAHDDALADALGWLKENFDKAARLAFHQHNEVNKKRKAAAKKRGD